MSKQFKKSFGERDLEYAKDFWTIANVVVAFAVIQTLAFGMAVGPGEGALVKTIIDQRGSVTVYGLLGTASYLLVIWVCQSRHSKIVFCYDVSEVMVRSFQIWNAVRLLAVALLGLTATALIWNVHAT